VKPKYIFLRDKHSGIESNYVSMEDILYNQNYVEFVFQDEYGIIAQLPYKDFIDYKDDYEVVYILGVDKE